MDQQNDQAWHVLPAERVLEHFGVDRATGLSHEEVLRRQQEHGPNRVSANRGTPLWLKFVLQFNQPLVYILLAAVMVTAFLGEWVDSSVILGVVLINAVIGFLQESKAEKAVEALARMVATDTSVRRERQKRRVPSHELVPGDLALLEAGDRVPADVRVFHARDFHVDESALTGESLPVEKQPDALAHDTVLAERKNIAYAGALVTKGKAEGVVCAIGDRTETGRIGRLIAGADDLSTPLTRKIASLSRLLLWAIMVVAVLAFAIGVLRGNPPTEMFMAAVALAVGAIPEGLPAAVTIVLAIGVARMAKRRAIIRRLPAVETLGSTTVICSDKTGTLTENQMTVREVHADGRAYAVTGTGYDPAGELRLGDVAISMPEHPALAECLRAGVLCNEAELRHEDGKIAVHGDPTEAALLVAAQKGGIVPADLRREMTVLDSIPFNSENMFRATMHTAPGDGVIYKVGALERLLDTCVNARGTGDSAATLDREGILRAAEGIAGRGLRVLALARRFVDAQLGKLEPADVANGFTFLGLQGMMDPPRPAAVEAVRKCQRAGIAVKMITGDHLATARVVAAQIGLHGRAENGLLVAMSGRDLEKVTDDDLPGVADRTAVFARVAPEQKLRLVRALQACGHVVAMTGDGVNDAPALKQADIGVAMGIAGTDVAKGAASMILLDDNFASIEAAVEEGRGVFDNLTKFIVWTLPTNAGEAAVLIIAILFGTALPALPVQLLWVNLTTSIFLGLMLVFEPKETDLMTRPPRDPKRPLLTFALIMRTGLVSLIMLIGAFWLFFYEKSAAGESEAAARTAVINVIVLVEIAYLFSCRSLTRSQFSIGWFTNRWVIIGTLGMVAAQLAFTYVPVMNTLFHTAPLGTEAWGRIAFVALVAFIAVEFEKWIRFGRRHQVAS
jgi:Ca2+-transporting ATPase